MSVKIGIFLPFSRSNPLSSANISAGIKAGFACAHDQDIEIRDYTVTSSKALLTETLMRAFIVDEIDIAIANIGYSILPQVLAKLKLSDKILFLTSVGANIVREKDRHPLVFRNTLMYWQSLYLTGYEAYKRHHSVFTATNTLESGFDSYLAYISGVEDAGGSMPPFHQCDERDYVFRAQPCIDKIEAADYATIAALASGDDTAKIQNEVIAKLKPHHNREIIYSAFFHESPIAEELESQIYGTHSYFGWADSLLDADTEVVRAFMKSWTGKSKRRPDAFSILGYETAKIICQGLDKCEWDASDAQQMAKALELAQIKSPRGILAMDAEAHTINAPVYLRNFQEKDGNAFTMAIETFNAPKDSNCELNARISLNGSRWTQDYLFL